MKKNVHYVLRILKWLSLCIILIIIVRGTLLPEWQFRNGDIKLGVRILMIFSVVALVLLFIRPIFENRTLFWLASLAIISMAIIPAWWVFHPLDTTTEPYDQEVLEQLPGNKKRIVRSYMNAKTNRKQADTIVATDWLIFRRIHGK